MSVCVCVCFLFIPPFTHALPPPRPAVNLDMKACCCDRTNKNQTNPLDYSPLSELFPVSSPDRKSGMRDSSLPVVVWGNAKDVDTHALQHTDTQIYQTESRVQFSCLTADRVGVCVSVSWWTSRTRDGKRTQTNHHSNITNMGFPVTFAIFNFLWILKPNVNEGRLKDLLDDLSS